MVQSLYEKNAFPGTTMQPLYNKLSRGHGSASIQKKLPGLGSNQGLQLQRLTCYRYTTGQ